MNGLLIAFIEIDIPLWVILLVILGMLAKMSLPFAVGLLLVRLVLRRFGCKRDICTLSGSEVFLAGVFFVSLITIFLAMLGSNIALLGSNRFIFITYLLSLLLLLPVLASRREEPR